MLKLGFTLLNLANICLHISTDSISYPFTASDKDLLKKTREYMVGGPSIVFTLKALVEETFIRKLTSLWKSIVGIDASQLFLFSMCQPTPTGLYTKWNYDIEGLWHKIHASTEQNTLFQKIGPFLFSTNSFGLHNWKQCENW